MSTSKMVAGFAGVELTLPHTGEKVTLPVPGFEVSCRLLNLFERSKVDDGAVEPLMREFCKVVQLPVEKLDGLTPAEMAGIVSRFFSARRDLPPELRKLLEPPSPDSAPSSTGPS